MFTHVVIFWFNDNVDKAAALAQIRNDSETLLKPISGLKWYSIGTPANTPRPVVDSSHDFALCTVYEDRAGHDAYQIHPNHQQFLANNKPNFKKIVVYDFV